MHAVTFDTWKIIRTFKSCTGEIDFHMLIGQLCTSGNIMLLAPWAHHPPKGGYCRGVTAGAPLHMGQRITMDLEVSAVIQTRGVHGSGYFHVMTSHSCHVRFLMIFKHFSQYWPFERRNHQSLDISNFPAQRPVMQRLDGFVVVGLDKLWNKQLNGWWIKMPWCSMKPCYLLNMIHSYLCEQLSSFF